MDPGGPFSGRGDKNTEEKGGDQVSVKELTETGLFSLSGGIMANMLRDHENNMLHF